MLVHDVPIFGELPKGARSNAEPIGRQWHLAALASAQQDEAGEYLPPLHVGHHDDHTKVERVGYLKLKRVGSIVYRGRARSCIYADMYCSRTAAKRIKAGDLPYCSVEIGPDWNKPEILCCALLDHEPPHFKFPLITLADDAKFSRVGTGLRVCFHAETEASMAAATKKKNAFKDPKKDDAKKPEEDPKDDAQHAEEGEPVEETPEENFEEETTEAPAWAKPLLTIPVLLEKLTALLTGGKDDAAAPADGTPPLAEPSYKAGKGKTLKATDNSPENIQLRAKVAALEAESEQNKKAAKLSVALADARKQLGEKGWTITPGIEKTLADAAKIGTAALKLTVETFAAHVVKDPPSDVETGLANGAGGNAASVEELPEELEAFAEKGPNRLALGRRLYNAWGRTREKGSELTFDAYCRVEGVTP